MAYIGLYMPQNLHSNFFLGGKGPWLYITDRLRCLSLNWGVYRYAGI